MPGSLRVGCSTCLGWGQVREWWSDAGVPVCEVAPAHQATQEGLLEAAVPSPLASLWVGGSSCCRSPPPTLTFLWTGELNGSQCPPLQMPACTFQLHSDSRPQ